MKHDNPFFTVENININSGGSARWVEDNFDTKTDGMSEQYLSLSLSSKKLRVFLIILMIGMVALFLKSFYLQIIQGGYYFSLAENNRLRTQYVLAQRGIIYDRHGQSLVRNVSGFSLLLTRAALPRDKEQQNEIFGELSRLANIPITEIEQLVDDSHQYLWQPVVIKTGINYEEAMLLKIAIADYPSVELQADYWRDYRNSVSTANLLGYIGKINTEEYEVLKDQYLLSDSIGKIGLEKYYEQTLKGQHGEKVMEVDAFGRTKKVVSNQSSISGSDLILTIDADLQDKIYQILIERLDQSKPAAVIVSDPQSGEILAMVDYPGYDSNLFSVGISTQDYQALLTDERKPLFARSISGEYPSGSTIKPVIASGALEEGIVNRFTSFSSVGGIWVLDQWFFPDWKAGGHGIINVIKALAESVNTYFYYIGGGYLDFEGLGVEKINYYLSLFGLGRVTGIDLPGEKSGLVPTPAWKEETKNEVWYIGDTYHLAIGQGDLLVTPLQVNAYVVAIANGGKLYRPHLVKEIIHPDGQKELIMPEIVASDLISQQNIDIVREGMRQTIISGSAQSLYNLPVEVAGKTGTAQWNQNKANHAWFTAFAPYDNSEIAITVLVEEGGEGSTVAVPIARDVIYYYFTRDSG